MARVSDAAAGQWIDNPDRWSAEPMVIADFAAALLEVRDVLRRLEWINPQPEYATPGKVCPWCAAKRDVGHTDDCAFRGQVDLGNR